MGMLDTYSYEEVEVLTSSYVVFASYFHVAFLNFTLSLVLLDVLTYR